MIVTVYDDDGSYEFRADGLVQTVDAFDLVLDDATSVSVEYMFSVAQSACWCLH